jgi:heptosyltransferase I
VGDIVLLSAVIRQIKLKFPDSVMTIICSPNNSDFAGYLTNCRVIPVSHKKPFQWFRLRRLPRVDVLVDFGAWARFDALLSLFVPAGFRLGFATVGQYRHYCYDAAVQHSAEKHEIDNYYALAEDYCEQTGILPHVEVKTDSSIKDTIILHMYCSGARYACRMWDFENWIKLGILIKNNGFNLGFTSCGAESLHLKALLHSERIDAIVIDDRSPGELASIFCSCRGIVSLNCGISHFAAACGASVLELTGSVNPARWGTIGAKVHRVIPSDINKTLCYGFEKDADENCMDRVTPQEVFELMKKVFPKRA